MKFIPNVNRNFLALALSVMKNIAVTPACQFAGVGIVRPAKTSRKRRAK
jgi:hypothetical protein